MKSKTIFWLLLVITGFSCKSQSSKQSSQIQNTENTRVVTGQVQSKDGTQIAYTKFGNGPALIVCYGAYGIMQDWDNVAKEISSTHTVYLYDRRGHGKSPYSGQPYTYDSELDDLAAMVKLAGGGATLFGHSFGGGCVLAYAIRDSFKGRIILYEPVHSLPRQLSRGHLPQLKAMVEKNDMEAATEFAFENIVRMPKPFIEQFKKDPNWHNMVELTRPFANEVWLLDQFEWAPEQLASLPFRTWVLLGTERKTSRSDMPTTESSLVDRITGITLYPIQGQGHFANSQNPKLLAQIIKRCLTDK